MNAEQILAKRQSFPGDCMKINIFNGGHSGSSCTCYRLLNFDLTLSCHRPGACFYANSDLKRATESLRFISAQR